MYFEKDYIMRQIMMLGEFLKRLMRLCDDQKAEDAHNLLGELCEKELGFSLSAAKTLPLASLLQFLDDNQRFVLAEVVYMESEVLLSIGEEEAAMSMREKALSAILAASHTPETAAYRHVRVKTLADSMPEVPFRDRLKLAQFYVLSSRYDDAEDALYACLDCAPDQLSAVREAGIAFYKQLRGRSDGELAAGGFSRAEIDDGLRAWERKSGI